MSETAFFQNEEREDLSFGTFKEYRANGSCRRHDELRQAGNVVEGETATNNVDTTSEADNGYEQVG